MLTKRILTFIVLFILGMVVFLLPIREHDYLRLRYFIGLWFFAEAAFRMTQTENWMTPLFLLVGKYRLVRDRVVAGIALAAFFTVLYLAVWLLMDNVFLWLVKLVLAVAVVLVTWLIYYGICFLFGTQELRDGALPAFVRKWIWRSRNSR
jgi:hypothetical protein